MMRNSDKEQLCSIAFAEAGECHHLWTPENFEIIFTCEDDFRTGMGIVAVCAKLFPDVRLITYELMSNHLHVTAACTRSRMLDFFSAVKKMLAKMVRALGRTADWDNFEPGIRRLTTLEDVRNVIAYDNRNGFVVSPEHSPYTYPWGANKYYFNPDAVRLAKAGQVAMSYREKREVSHSHIANGINGIMCFDGCALPLSFCDINLGERLFRDASHYFYKVSRNIEANARIAKEIGESICYNDDELFSAVTAISKKQFGEGLLTNLSAEQKISVARTMRYEFNASPKQIQRFLKIPRELVASLGL